MNVILDTEVYRNYFLANFTFEDGHLWEYEKLDDDCDHIHLADMGRWLMNKGHTLITFNGQRYDMPILSMAMSGWSNSDIKDASDRIIQRGAMWWEIEQKYNFRILEVDHIDIINLLPLYESLKLYGARGGTKKLQDLPFDPSDIITRAKADELVTYCRNDCQITWERFMALSSQLDLRVEMGVKYGMDLRSKSDAQIAEAVMKSEYEKLTNTKLVKPIDAGTLPKAVGYTAPEWVRFNDPKLTQLVDKLEFEGAVIGFELKESSGKPISPTWMRGKTVKIDGKPYAIGLGGLHAKNKSESYFSGSRGQIIDIDVASYYPRIILNEGYEPPHMHGTFTQIYEALVDRRLSAKADGDKVSADALKITINGTYGKLGSKYSAIYAPELLLGVTFTGQLALLMLIEMMAQNGIQTLSANTDGVTVLSTSSTVTSMVVAKWERITGFVMEYTMYKSIHYRDVNNYFAQTIDDEIKTKGIFKPPGIAKNPTAPIVTSAVTNHVLYGLPIKDTINKCIDIELFLSVRTVKGGGAKDGEYLGKAVRWYYSTDTDTAIHYISNGNKVAKTDGAMPMMDLIPGLPKDLNLDWYIDEAEQTLTDIGYFPWS